ncbi:MAG: 16S rRNA (guanine(527)-N(7))-methyltransferase RsmG [Candidatus Andeanibacterium colombiense]|uniref:Ribosomal RNA small subunit methyltransferase G n=1 Tax=Candidatus Andeanibacterium colombiense TaxID=3121345 RepID=A0AAJ5X4I7_9SPHN|nr:MAG: 16S rRNA (guanine(527)-N(7))-methyltransferase RsmG [Sphingomonadaceae bacterium]
MITSEEQARAFIAQHADAPALERLDRLVDLLAAENADQNLIAAATLPLVWQRHLADSAQLLTQVPRGTSDPGPWLDLGTGAGFPGLVISALRPEWDVRLVESRRRRCEWLERARIALRLDRCRVVAARLEVVESFAAGVISARAFAPLPKLLDLSTRFSTARTLWLLPKGRSAAQELVSLPESKRRLFHVEQSLTDPDAGIVVGRLATGQKD